MRIVIATLLFLLAACADTPSKPTTTGGSSSGSGKIVTATPEETFECDEDLILEPHLPEECIPPEPVVQKPAEPPKPDPIVGAYVFYLTEVKEEALVVRVYPNNRARSDFNHYFRWENAGDKYYFYFISPIDRSETLFFSVKYAKVSGSPELLSGDYNFPYWDFEGVQFSKNPDHLFDHYWLSTGPDYDTSKWFCINTGRKEKRYKKAGTGLGIPQYGETREICEARCPRTLSIRFPGATCPQDRR